MIAMNDATIRLACEECDRDDKDFITPQELEQCKAEGWTDINEVRSFEEATRTDDQPANQPEGCGILAWYTHLGICPECQAED
jgi:hypothetical protein